MSSTVALTPTCDTDARNSGSPRGSLKRLAIRGSIWTIAGYGTSQVLRLGSNLILSRLLFPEAFGLMALITVFMQGLAMFSDVGIGPSIVQNKDGEAPAFLNTAWTIQVIRGAALAAVACLIAWPVARIYGQPILLKLIPVAGLSALIAGFNSTSVFVLNRRMAVGYATLLQLITQIISLVILISAALLFRSVWSLVLGNLIGAVVYAVATHMIADHRDQFDWNREACQSLMHFGRWIFLSTLLSFLASQVDRLLLGWYVPVAALGVYSIATTLAVLAREITARLASSVLFPAFALQMKRGSGEVSRTLLRARSLILTAGLPATLLITLGSPLFFTYLYDPRYHDAGWMAQLFAISCWISILQLSADRLLLAQGNSRALAISNVWNFVVSAVACFAGYRFAGISGFLVGFAVGSLAGHVWIQFELARVRIRILSQDLRYSGALSALVLIGILIPKVAPTIGIAAFHVPQILGIPVLLVGATAIWSLFRMKRGLCIA